jgi:C-8 sterol isomerase
MSYLFDPATLQALACPHIGQDPEAIFAAVIEELARAYPGHIETRQDWVYSLAGGAVGIMTIMHGSLSEYLILFGTPIGTSGFSGRYWMDVYDILLSGEMWTYTEKQFHQRIVTRPGEMALLRRGEVKGFRLAEGSWVLEYGRGVVPASLPFALSDALISCLDWWTILKTLWLYGRLVVRELFHGKV